MQQSQSKDLRNSEAWSAGTFMPGSLAREISVFEIRAGDLMNDVSWFVTEYLFH